MDRIVLIFFRFYHFRVVPRFLISTEYLTGKILNTETKSISVFLIDIYIFKRHYEMIL